METKTKAEKKREADIELHNALMAFEAKKNWKFVYDIVRNKFFTKNEDGELEELNPYLYVEIIRREFGKISLEYFIQHLTSPNVSEYMNPLKDWFKHLVFDPQKDYIKEICSYIQLDNGSQEEKMRLENCLKKWFVGAVKTLFDDYYVHKPALILAGESGLGKTPFIDCLLPKKLNEFKNCMSTTPIHTKDGLIALTRTFLMTLDEVDDLFKNSGRNKGLLDAYKSAATISSVNVRVPYGRTQTLRKRIACFFGSCNRSTFLNDPTGSQRFTIFKVSGLRNNRDFLIERLWAQAYRLFQEGFNPEMTKKELILNEHSNQPFKNFGKEYEVCAKHVEKAEKGFGNFVTATDIMVEIQKFSPVHLNLCEKKIGAALGKMGFDRRCQRINGMPTWGYDVFFKGLIQNDQYN